MNSFAMNLGALWTGMPFLINGLLFSIALTLGAATGGVILGTLIACMRLSGRRLLVGFAFGYVTLFRCVPLLLVIFWFYFLMPLVMQWLTGARFPVPIGPVYSAFITFTIFEAAYYSEIIRAGIQSVARGQIEAAQALRLSPVDTYRYIILPQAIRRMLPVLLTQTIVLFQDSSLVYVLALPDFFSVASRLGQLSGETTFFYLFVALVFFLICYSLSRAVRRLGRAQP